MIVQQICHHLHLRHSVHKLLSILRGRLLRKPALANALAECSCIQDQQPRDFFSHEIALKKLGEALKSLFKTRTTFSRGSHGVTVKIKTTFIQHLRIALFRTLRSFFSYMCGPDSGNLRFRIPNSKFGNRPAQKSLVAKILNREFLAKIRSRCFRMMVVSQYDYVACGNVAFMHGLTFSSRHRPGCSESAVSAWTS